MQYVKREDIFSSFSCFSLHPIERRPTPRLARKEASFHDLLILHANHIDFHKYASVQFSTP